MTDKERKELLSVLEKFKKEVCRNKKAKTEFLASVGITDAKGNLIWPYENLGEALQLAKEQGYSHGKRYKPRASTS